MPSQIRDLILKLRYMDREDGQDLVEYALVVALIGFAATAGMSTLAGDINSLFGAVGSKLTIT